MIYLPIAMAFIGLAFMFTKRAWVLKQDPGDGKMKEISDYIYEGGLPQSRISFINILCYWCQYCFGRNFIYRSTTHILIVVAFIFEHFLCFGWKYGNENRKKRMLELPSRTYEFASSLKSFFGGGTVMGVAGLAVLGLTFIFFFHFL
jgi:K(+)-stimulated pyrophosphate-energized sodium pump